MTRTDLAVLVTAAAAVAGIVWLAFTRNGRHALHVIVVAAHYRFVPTRGEHGHEEEPERIRDMLRALALAAAWHMPRYWWWRDRAARAVRECLHWPAGQIPRPEMLREPVAASAPGDGPAPEAVPSGAGPLTDATAAVSPYPPPTEPQPALREELEPLPAARPYVLAEEYLP